MKSPKPLTFDILSSRELFSYRSKAALEDTGFTFTPFLNTESYKTSPDEQMWLLFVCRIAKGQKTFYGPTELKAFLEAIGPARVDINRRLIWLEDKPKNWDKKVKRMRDK